MSTSLDEVRRRESDRFVGDHPACAQASARMAPHWLCRVPMHWMSDWPTPFPLVMRNAQGASLTDIDGHRYDDFCLGDTGAMFGHSPPSIAAALEQQVRSGLTAMLPSEHSARVGEGLAQVFGLPFWQMTQTATDANRAALRWSRAITGRARVLVFEGCYHGTVDETMVRVGAIGSAFDATHTTKVVEFNDLDAVESELRRRDLACVLYEPVMTNCGMVLPEPGFHAALRDLTRRYETLLIADETHTLSTGLGGYTRAHALDPDFLVCGKAIAGGVPCAVYGFTSEVEHSIQRVLADRGGGHSGIGTTLAGNALAVSALDAALRTLHTEDVYATMIALGERLEAGLKRIVAHRELAWTVSRVGARTELVPGATAPRNGTRAAANARHDIESALHLFALNRGVLLTPFHNMMLTSPVTTREQVDRLLAVVGEFFDVLH